MAYLQGIHGPPGGGRGSAALIDAYRGGSPRALQVPMQAISAS
jgi:hypothetical protein